jgi:hypothetical protein
LVFDFLFFYYDNFVLMGQEKGKKKGVKRYWSVTSCVSSWANAGVSP